MKGHAGGPYHGRPNGKGPEPLTYGKKGRRQRWWEPAPLLAGLGLLPTLIRFPTPGAELAASFHLEITAPPEVSIVRASMLAGTPNLRFDNEEPNQDRSRWKEWLHDANGNDRFRHARVRRRPSFDSVGGGYPTVDLHVADVPFGSSLASPGRAAGEPDRLARQCVACGPPRDAHASRGVVCGPGRRGAADLGADQLRGGDGGRGRASGSARDGDAAAAARARPRRRLSHARAGGRSGLCLPRTGNCPHVARRDGADQPRAVAGPDSRVVAGTSATGSRPSPEQAGRGAATQVGQAGAPPPARERKHIGARAPPTP